LPGIATHFHVLDQTIAQLPPSQSAIANLLQNNPYAYLGALGPALMDFISSDPAPPASNPTYATVWRKLLSVVGGDPGLIATVGKIQALINEIQQLADARDCHGLENFRDSGKLNTVQTLSDQFTTLLSTVDTIAGDIYNIISQDLKPKFCTLDPTAPTPPPTQWPARDFFSWKKTGAFTQALISRANSTGDNRLLAYAYGWLVAYATNVTGSPFINAVVGGPPRTQWWRQRFIKNYVDAWVFGYYGAGATMTGDGGDTPNPPYDQWPSLCSANLHKKIEIPNTNIQPQDFLNQLDQPFPQVVPADFAANLFLAIKDVYGTAVPPEVVPGGLNSAYLMTWLMLWFQTSGVPFGCNLVPPPGPPSNCTGDPPDTNPFNFGPGGTPPGPPIPSPDVTNNTADQVCGVILAILGGALFVFGAGLAGAASLAGGLALLDCSNAVTVDWNQWECKIFWFKQYMFNGLVGLQHMLSLAGFTYPEAKALALDTNALSLAGINLPFESAINLVKTPREGREQQFPSKCWNTTTIDKGVLTFNQRPTAANPGFETPRTIAYVDGWQYPSWFVDGPGNPAAMDVKTDGGVFLRYDPPGSAVPFSNAVSNAVDLLQNLNKKFPNWNLDADRGLAYYTWQFKAGYDPDNVQIIPEP